MLAVASWSTGRWVKTGPNIGEIAGVLASELDTSEARPGEGTVAPRGALHGRREFAETIRDAKARRSSLLVKWR
jgi:hypothetical protein